MQSEQSNTIAWYRRTPIRRLFFVLGVFGALCMGWAGPESGSFIAGFLVGAALFGLNADLLN